MSIIAPDLAAITPAAAGTVVKLNSEAPRTYVRGICPLQALERQPPNGGSLSLHGLTSVDSREGIE